ncbi:hypothetical protein [Bradyrhizobium sp. 1(2017)]|uniref:hypothetical protein n=1 Tax=Bradyrhizobium sp. 1(2017) TaxID=1404888 RepID=UPI00140F3277|nr:hypothetical protein [Bradyrhizobium sp. 1(2017)]QIO34357.1 hypothetical protein HAP40_22435 [Bradyrhizobium sp. 1(2017)]
MKKIKGFEEDFEGYKSRLRLLREAVAAGSQQVIADKLKIDMKRWNNYERGYPIPREIAFILKAQTGESLAEWLWWGDTGNLSPQFTRKLQAAEATKREREKAEAEFEAAKMKLESLKKKQRPRKKRPKQARPAKSAA